MSKLILLVGLVLPLGLLAGCGSKQSNLAHAKSSPESSKDLQIAVIPMGANSEYWRAVHAGAESASQDLAKQGRNVKILWRGPVNEDDRKTQIEIVDSFKHVDGIALAPLDADALAGPVEDAVNRGIPVVDIDSPVNSQKTISFVATDNEKAGKLAARKMSEMLNGKGRVLVFRYAQGTGSCEMRINGFLDGIKQSPGIAAVTGNEYAGPTIDTAYRAAKDLLGQYGSGITGVFTPNETSTRGMRLALKERGLLHKVKFIGFDSSLDEISALKANEIQGLVVQSPFKIGYDGVMALADHAENKPVAPRIDTGVSFVTPANMDTPKMAQALRPPMD